MVVRLPSHGLARRAAAFAIWAYTFVCRKAYRLAYRSQRKTPRDRARPTALARCNAPAVSRAR